MAFSVTVPPLGPFSLPLTVVVGDTLSLSFRVEALDLRAYTLTMTARTSYDAETALWEATSAVDGGIVVTWDGDDSVVQIDVPPESTAAMPTGIYGEGCVWDLRWADPDGVARTVLSGPLYPQKSVTYRSA